MGVRMNENENEKQDKDKLFVAQAYGESDTNPMRLPNIVMYGCALLFHDLGGDTIELKSNQGIVFKIQRIETKPE